jgi:XTP/dITP diphosphohydrolase
MPKTQSFTRLLEVMDDLREKCPWDKKQTFESLRYLTIEETYELSEAIQEMEPEEIKKELGDVLLHIVFYARIASEKGWFDIKDVMDSLVEKLIHRHPHIYGDVVAEDEETVKQNWELIKLKEKGNKGLLDGVPKGLPSMVKAARMQEKVSQVGFDWENKQQVWAKVEEELDEFKTADTQERKSQELGDLFFALINYARFEGINPDDALEYTNKKFKNRFQFIEQRAKENNETLSELTLTEMDAYWEESKSINK